MLKEKQTTERNWNGWSWTDEEDLPFLNPLAKKNLKGKETVRDSDYPFQSTRHSTVGFNLNSANPAISTPKRPSSEGGAATTRPKPKMSYARRYTLEEMNNMSHIEDDEISAEDSVSNIGAPLRFVGKSGKGQDPGDRRPGRRTQGPMDFQGYPEEEESEEEETWRPPGGGPPGGGPPGGGPPGGGPPGGGPPGGGPPGGGPPGGGPPGGGPPGGGPPGRGPPGGGPPGGPGGPGNPWGGQGGAGAHWQHHN